MKPQEYISEEEFNSIASDYEVATTLNIKAIY